MKQTFSIGLIVFAAAILIGYAALSFLSEKRPPKPDCRPVEVQLSTIQISVDGMGSVKPKQIFHVKAKRPGKVAAILVEKDEKVKEKQPLMRVSPEPGFAVHLDTLRYHLYTARLQRQTLQTNLDKQRKLFDRGMVAQAVIEDLERNLTKAEMEEALANEQLKALAQDTGQPLIASDNNRGHTDPLDIFILAPSSGTILDINKQVGDVIFADSGTGLEQKETTVVILADLSELFVECMVNEIDIKSVQVGQSAMIRLEAEPDKAYSGIIKKISKFALPREPSPHFDDGGLHYFTAFVKIENPDNLVRPGMTCNVEIVIQKKKEVLVLPVETVFKEMNQTFAIAESVQDFENKVITTGISDEHQVEITSGLNAGDAVCGQPLVVLEWQDQIRQYEQRNFVERLLR